MSPENSKERRPYGRILININGQDVELSNKQAELAILISSRGNPLTLADIHTTTHTEHPDREPASLSSIRNTIEGINYKTNPLTDHPLFVFFSQRPPNTDNKVRYLTYVGVNPEQEVDIQLPEELRAQNYVVSNLKKINARLDELEDERRKIVNKVRVALPDTKEDSLLDVQIDDKQSLIMQALIQSDTPLSYWELYHLTRQHTTVGVKVIKQAMGNLREKLNSNHEVLVLQQEHPRSKARFHISSDYEVTLYQERI